MHELLEYMVREDMIEAGYDPTLESSIREYWNWRLS